MMKRSTISLTIETFGKTAIDIGRLAENQAVQVRVDLSSILSQEPKATASMVVESPSGDKYSATTRMAGQTLIWDVLAADVASAGMGKAQLTIMGANGEVLKSAVAVIRISGSIVGNGQAPNPVQNWIDSATKALNEAYAIVAELQQKLDDGEFVGPQGDPGATGATPNIQIGTVSTGNPGTNVEASMSGTPENPLLNLKIPRGEDGSGSVSKVDGVDPASGNVPLGAVRYSAAQNLTEAQQAQARENISAAKNAAMTGATASAAGAAGLVPAPSAGDEKKALLGNGTWGNVASSGGVHVGDTAPTDENTNTWIDTSEDAGGYLVENNLNQETPGIALLDAHQGKVLLELTEAVQNLAKKWAGAVNLLDNSNFEIAQASYGGNHGSQAYACDRWKLVSGTVSHSDAGLTLNGTIAQVLENAPSGPVTAAASAGTITYDASAKIVTIATTEATVIAWAALYEGEYSADTLPPYTPKGYAAELAECQRYFNVLPSAALFLAQSDVLLFCNLLFPQMRIVPTITLIANSIQLYGTTSGFTANVTINESTVFRGGATIGLSTTGAESGTIYRGAPSVERFVSLSADL